MLCIVTMEKQELFPSFSFKQKKKKLIFLGNKTEFYQRLKVEDNTICLGYVFWVVRFGPTFGLT